MRKPSRWKHKKFPKKEFVGTYERTRKNKRVLVLFYKVAGVVRTENEIFESHEKAKDAGWKKVG